MSKDEFFLYQPHKKSTKNIQSQLRLTRLTCYPVYEIGITQ
jgi:hypothetical protein